MVYDGAERREDEGRLARIENKLDKLSDAVVAIARTEEQITTIFAAQRGMEAKLEEHAKEISLLREKAHNLTNKTIELGGLETKIDKLEDEIGDLRMNTHDNTQMTARIEKVTWMVAAALISIITYFINGTL